MSFIKKHLRSVGLKVKPQKLPYLLCLSALLATQLSAAPATSGIKQETWTNISGQSVSDLTAHAAYPEFPDQQSIVTDLFERTFNSASQSGVRLSGLLKIDTTGSYNFWMASDDAGELWLSSDSDPANKIKITSVDTWTGFRSWTVQSAAIHLVAGQKYYIEAISKAGGGIDHLSVAWQGPGITQAVIPASQVEIGAAAPTAASDALAVIGGGTTAIDVLANDWSSEALSIKYFTQPANGSVSLNSKGFLQYTANVNYVGNDSFSYTVEDSSGLTSVATVEVSVNATLDLVAAQNAILSGVSSLANELVHKNYAPARTVAYGPSAGNLYRLAHNESTAAVATWQNGRVVAVPTKLISAWGTIQSSGDTAAFLTNSIDWAAQKSSAVIISSSPELASWLGGQGYSASSSASWWNELAGKDAVLISLADVDDYNDAAAIAALKTFVRAGGGLIIAGDVISPWTRGKFQDVLAEAGLGWYENYREGAVYSSSSRPEANSSYYDFVSVINAGSSLSNIGDATDIAANFAGYNDIIGKVLSSKYTGPYNIPTARLMAFIKAQKITPTVENPIADSLQTVLLDIEADYLKSLSPDDVPEHRSADLVYGDLIPSIARTRELVHIPLLGQDWSLQAKWQPTGLYCGPGEKVSLRFPAAALGKGITVRVTNDASTTTNYKKGVYVQSPRPQRTFAVDSETVEVANHMGGCIFIVIPSKTTLASFDVEVTGALKMPYFRAGIHTNEDWNNDIKKRVPGVFILETDDVFNMTAASHSRDTSDMERVSDFWVRSFNWMNYLRGWDVYKPEKFPVHQYALLQTQGGFNFGLTANHWAGSGHELSSDSSIDKMYSSTPHGWYHESGHSHGHSFYNSNNQPWRVANESEADANRYSSFVTRNMMTDIRNRDGANHWAWRDYDFEKTMKIPGLGGYKSIIDGGGYYEADSRNGFWNLIMWDHGNDIFHAVVLKAHADEVNYADYNESTSWMMKNLSLEAGRDFSAWFEWASFTLTQADKDAVAHLPSWIPVHGSVLASTTAVNIPVVIDLTSTAHSSDGIVTLLSSTNPRSGSLVDNGDGTVTYTPNGAFEGYDAFRYTLKSSTGDTGTQEVVLTVGAPTVANKEPQAIEDIVSTNENTSVTLAVMSNDSDPDADILELTEVRQPMYGQTTLNGDGTLTYTPNDGFSGKDEFMYVVVDGRGGIDRATVFVTINNTVNQAPNFSASSLSKAHALTTKMYLAEVRSDAIDLDDNDKLNFSKVSGPAWMNVTSQGSITGIPTSADLGINSLTVRVSDGTLSSEATVEVTVENQTGTGSLAPPTFNSSIIANLSATEDAPFSGSISNSANDSDANILTYKKAAGAQWLQIAADGTLSGTPDNEVVGVNTFYVEVSDSISGTDIAILTIDVANTNDAPTSTQTFINETMIAKTPYQKSIASLIEDDDIGETFTYSKFSGPAWLSVNPDGTLSGVPTGNDTSGNTFVIRVTDSVGTYVDITLTLENYSGSSIVEYWDGIAGPAVSDLTDNVNYPDSPGTTTKLTSGFELPSNRARDFGVRIRAFITPVVSGDYTFWIASDDSSDLNFSDYGRIAYVDGWSGEKSWDSKSSQKSAVMSLIAGQSYYMEVLMKAGGGGDHCAVAWQAPGGVREVIPMSVLVQNYYPDVINDTAIVTEGASVVISVLANDSDDNGDVLTIASVTQGSNGSVVINGTSVTYTPNANFSGADSFTYVASDGNGGSRPATVNITVTNINNIPTAAADSYTITERSAALDVLSNDVDLDGDSLTIQSVTPAANGSVSFSASGVAYNVDADFAGNDSFTYTITDGNGANATATVTVEIPLPSGNGSGSVISHLWTEISGNLISTMTDLATYPNAPNSKSPLTSLEGASIGDNYGQLIRGYIHPPVTADYTFKSSGDDQVELWLSSDETSANISKVAYNTSWTNTKNWNKYPSQTSTAISLIAGQKYYFEVLHKEGSGDDHFAIAWQTPATPVVVIDGQYLSPYNLAPVLSAGADQAIDYPLSAVLDGTVSDDDLPTVSVTTVWSKVSGPGTVTFGDANAIDTTAAFSVAGTYLLRLTADDADLTSSDDLIITVSSINSAPVAMADSASVNEGSAVSIDVLANDRDADGDSLTVQSVTPAANGTVSFSASNVTYTAAADFVGNDSFTYTITDGNGGNATATVMVEILLPSGIGSVISHLWEDVSGNLISTMTGLVTYPNAPTSKATLTSLERASIGNEYGQLIHGYIHAPVTADYIFKSSGDDQVELWLSSDATAGNISKIAYNTLWTNTEDWNKYPSQTSTAVSLVAGQKYYFEVLHKEGGGGDGFAIGWQTSGTPVVVIDGQYLSPYNLAPVVSAGADQAIDFPASAVLGGTVSDDDLPTVSVTTVWSKVSGPGTVMFGDANAIDTSADFSVAGTYLLRLTADLTSSDDLIITVSKINSAPVAMADSASVNEDSSVTIAVLANDSDVEGSSLSISSATQAANGAVTVSGTEIIYTPTANFNGTDSFTYKVNDGLLSTVGNVTVTVNPVNDIPVANDDAYIISDVATELDVTTNDSDVDGDTLSVQSVVQAANGIVSFNGGSITYTPDDGFLGEDSFTYTVSDGNGETATAIVDVIVEGRIAHWTFNENFSSTTVDEKGWLDMNISGAQWASGIQASGLEFDGTDKLESTNAVTLPSAFTIALWVKPSILQKNRSMIAQNNVFDFKLHNSKLRFNSIGIATHDTLDVNLQTGVWQHLAVSFDAGITDGAKFYLNGVLVDMMDASALNLSSELMRIACNHSGTAKFKGTLDELQIFGHILTAAEIAELHVNP